MGFRTIDIDPARQVAAFIKDLSSPDYARRESAVTGLAKQPGRALAALRAAPLKANSDTRWWMDVAIQQIEAGSRPKATEEDKGKQ